MDTIRDSGSAIEEIFTPVGRTILGAGPLERRDPMNADPEVVGPVFYGDRPARRTADISIVIPVFNEVDALRALHRLLCAALERIAQSVEIVFCDDGSDDGSADLLDEIAASDLRISVVHLRRNYGQTAAIMAGIRRSAGAIIIAMDADGQNDPADIGRLIAKLDEGFDVVSGWRTDREDRALSRKLPSMICNRLLSGLLGGHLHDYGRTLKAYRREFIEDVRLYGEMHRFIPIYAKWEGARVAELPVQHHARKSGKSKYGLGRVARVILDVLILYFLDRAFDRPIQFFGKLGFLFFGLSSLVMLWALGLKYLANVSLIQTPLPLLAAIIGLSGILFILLGVMAEMQMRTYFESCGKPPYKVRNVVQHPSAPGRAEPVRW
jgi:glycosyltransferase involved in cell wall biosynthesis